MGGAVHTHTVHTPFLHPTLFSASVRSPWPRDIHKGEDGDGDWGASGDVIRIYCGLGS